MPATFTHPDLSTAALAAALAGAGFEVDPPAPCERIVLDTFDGRLHAAGLRLEVRRGPGEGLVLVDRRGAPPARLVAAGVPGGPGDLPVGPFRSRVAAVVVERALLPLLRVTSQCSTARRVDRRGKATVVAEVHVDVGVDDVPVPGAVLEVTPVAGHEEAASAVAARLAGEGLVETAGDLMDVLAQRAGRSIEGHSSSPTVPMEPTEDAGSAFRRVLANLAATIDANLDGAVADTDVEFLHEVRVAARRTRSVLAESKGVVPREVRQQFGKAFGWLGQITGPARDLDVYVLGWDQYVAPLGPEDRTRLDPVLAELVRRRAAAHRELAAALRSETCGRVLDDWRRWVAEPTGSPDAPAVGALVARRIAKAQERVLEGGRAITPASPPERLHDLRKDTKKLRYLLECFGTLLPAKERKAFVSQLKALQDNLGEHQDAEVHLAQLRALARDLHDAGRADADVLLAMGRLTDHLDRRRLEERAAFVERFAAYDTKANRQILADLLASVAGR